MNCILESGLFSVQANPFACWSLENVILRLLCAFIIGGIIGFDRGIKRRGAGLKTHTLICLSAALVMITGQYIYINFPGNMDVSRLGAQVISGVGFLGVGTIIVTERNQVRGLTTAASCWACACMGLAIGIGFFAVSLVMCIFILLVLHIMPPIDAAISKYSKRFDLFLEFKTVSDFTDFLKRMYGEGVDIKEIDVATPKVERSGIAVFLALEVKDRSRRKTFIKYLRTVENVMYVEEA